MMVSRYLVYLLVPSIDTYSTPYTYVMVVCTYTPHVLYTIGYMY